MAWITPIYDRTQQDVDSLKQLASNIKAVGWDNATLSQKTAWLNVSSGITKGALNAIDLNRIQGNTTFLRDLLSDDYGIRLVIDESNPIWTVTMTPFQSNIDRIRSNVIKIVENSYKYPDTPDVEYNHPVTWDDVNDIERNLADLYEILLEIAKYWIHCGQFNCGQGVIL